MKIIKSSNKIPSNILVDDSTYIWAKDKTWYVNHDGYAITRISPFGDGRSTYLQLHRVIKGDPDGKLVDHWDRDKMNCQEYNLRICTKGENQRNSTYKIPGATSIHKGVSWHTSGKKWRAQISFNRKRYWLGYYNTEIEAAKAYNTACLIYHKEFGVLNKV